MQRSMRIKFNRSSRLLVTIAITLATSIFFSKTSFAQAWDFLNGITDGTSAICNPTQSLFESTKRYHPNSDITSTVSNFVNGKSLSVSDQVFGMNIDGAVRCAVNRYVGVDVNSTCTLMTGAPVNQEDCDLLLEGVPPVTGQGLLNRTRDLSKSPVSGSLLGLYYFTDSAKNYADPPANLAYFYKQELKNVPFVGKALAADYLGTNNYVAWYIPNIYLAWKLIRNLAFALMSLIMLVVGIMMINRTKVNSQTIVTIQYALPKIILSVILIAFSYPIAAFITNFFFVLSRTAGAFISSSIVNGLGGISSIGGDVRDFVMETPPYGIRLGTLILNLLLRWMRSGFNIVAIIVMFLSLIVMLIQFIIIQIKWLMTYAKMIFEIILSPVDLVLAALPGTEDKSSGESKIIKWFKKMLAYGISLLVLQAVPQLVLWVGILVLIGSETSNVTLNGLVYGVPWMTNTPYDLIIFWIIIITGFSMASKLPGQIQYMLMGDKERSR